MTVSIGSGRVIFIHPLVPTRMYTEFETKHLLTFMLAGSATLTVISKTTNKHVTFTIRKAKKAPRFNVRHVGILVGYLEDMQFHYEPPTQAPTQAQTVMAFVWKNILLPDHLAKFVKVCHHGNCGRCGRALTDPESIERGIGPTCMKLTLKNQ